MKRLDEIQLSVRDRVAVERAAAALRDGFPVARVVLFGSKARGDDAAASDIDLLVLTGRRVSYREKEEMTRAVYPLELEMGVAISMLIIPQAKWDRGLCRLMPIHAEIERDGVAA